MKYCPNCATKAEDDAKFCPHCGSPFSYSDKEEESVQDGNKTLSIWAIVMGALGGIVGVILRLIGIASPKSSRKARVNCEIALALGILWSMLYIALALVLTALMIAKII